MTRVGSPVHEPCPECRSYNLKIALVTSERIYYRCLGCHNAWSEIERRKNRTSGRHVPERRRRHGGGDAGAENT